MGFGFKPEYPEIYIFMICNEKSLLKLDNRNFMESHFQMSHTVYLLIFKTIT